MPAYLIVNYNVEDPELYGQYAAEAGPVMRFGDACEIVAEKGAVVFWHGRSVHSPGIHTGDDIRWAMFADFDVCSACSVPKKSETDSLIRTISCRR